MSEYTVSFEGALVRYVIFLSGNLLGRLEKEGLKDSEEWKFLREYYDTVYSLVVAGHTDEAAEMVSKEATEENMAKVAWLIAKNKAKYAEGPSVFMYN